MANTTEMLIKALEIMCERCCNHDMCMGTGCEPKRKIMELIESQKKV